MTALAFPVIPVQIRLAFDEGDLTAVPAEPRTHSAGDDFTIQIDKGSQETIKLTRTQALTGEGISLHNGDGSSGCSPELPRPLNGQA